MNDKELFNINDLIDTIFEVYLMGMRESLDPNGLKLEDLEKNTKLAIQFKEYLKSTLCNAK